MIDTIRLKISNEKLYKELEKYKEQNLDDMKKAYVRLSGLKEKLLNGEIIELSIDDVKDINNMDSDLIVRLYEKGIDITFLDFFKINNLGSWNRDINVFLDCLNKCVFIEFSLNKMIFGHNLYNYENSVYHLFMFLSELYNRFNVEFNYAEFSKIELYRLDLSYNYKFNEDVISVLQSIFKKVQRYKRKKVHFYEGSLMFVGSWYSLKFYNKHEEFKKHDYKELKQRLEDISEDKILKSLGFHIYNGKEILVSETDKEVILNKILSSLVEYSKNLLRCELTIRRKKLEYDNILTLGDLDKLNLYAYFEYFLENMGVKKVRKYEIDELYNKIEDVNLLSFLLFIKEFGIEKAKEKYKKSTYYYYRKKLKDKYNIDIDVINFDNDKSFDFSVSSKNAVIKVA